MYDLHITFGYNRERTYNYKSNNFQDIINKKNFFKTNHNIKEFGNIIVVSIYYNDNWLSTKQERVGE